LDEVFAALKAGLIPLIQSVQQSDSKPETGFLRQTFDKAKQREFSMFILREMGYDFQAGRLDESVHPFATGLNPGDVRITTHFLQDDVTFALFGTIHEGGHALYEQNISEELIGTNLGTGTSMGIHESQSRFWENKIGSSRPFWHKYFSEFQRIFAGQFDDVSAEQFYRGINEAKPSLIRIKADELTYNLHIIIRYEIEKELIGGAVSVSDLPALWNEKYEQYLGIRPSHDGEGVLQDVHWAGGAFGYFPSYSLGNMYAAQFLRKMRGAIPELEGLIANGILAPIKDWLTENVYKYGKLEDPSEIMIRVTGEALNPNDLIDYLSKKYKDIYNLQ
jgi:carboxypeptidase Taq